MTNALEYMRAYQPRWRANRKAFGLCRDCPTAVQVGSRCELCREKHRNQQELRDHARAT